MCLYSFQMIWLIFQRQYSHLFVTLMLLSAVFLLLTAAFYVLLWDKQSNIHTWTILSMVVSMFFMYIFLAVANIMNLSISTSNEETGKVCMAVGEIEGA